MRRLEFTFFVLLFCVSFSSAQFNKAAHFFGNEGYINVPTDNSLRMAEEITIETWIKLDSLHSSQIGIAGSWNDLGMNERSWFLWLINNRFEFLVSSNGSSIGRTAGFITEIDTWNHVAGTFDGSVIKLYVNDSLISTSNYLATIHTNELPFYIGRTETGSNGSDYLFGWLDELRVWNKARSEDQIKQASKDTLDNRYYSSQDSGLVAYYRFDEALNLGIGVDSTLDFYDHSVEKNHGDIVGHVDLDSAGIVITAINNQIKHNKVENFKLLQNYPNPFNPSTVIKYELAKAGNLKLVIYDIAGREISTLVDSYQIAGSYSINFDASLLPSGIYFYKISSGSISQSKKMILIR